MQTEIVIHVLTSRCLGMHNIEFASGDAYYIKNSTWEYTNYYVLLKLTLAFSEIRRYNNGTLISHQRYIDAA